MNVSISLIFIQIELANTKKKNQHDDFSAPTSGAFDLEIGPYSGQFDQAFFKKSNARGFARGGGGMLTQTLLVLTGLHLSVRVNLL